MFIFIIVVQKQMVTLSTRVAKLIEIEGFKRYLEDRVNNLMDESKNESTRSHFLFQMSLDSVLPDQSRQQARE